MKIQQHKAELFHQLHHNGKMLVLPNIWDPLGAALLENLGYPAVATASASIAFTNGYDDGENIPFYEMLSVLNRIISNVSVPVTVDFESGYSPTLHGLEVNIRMLIKAGAIGINIEDFDKRTGRLFTVEQQCERIELIKNISIEMNVPVFINARTDVYIRDIDLKTDQEKFIETLSRGKEYLRAGGDCFFPIAMKTKNDIQNIISDLKCPVNILLLPGVPDLKTLEESGVSRVSLGSSFLKTSIRAMKDAAIRLLNYDGSDEITGNDVTWDYLKNLIQK
ncbi:MAG: isocitrate lyase/phosphoenolpyruvate mutase family protein [bacterium]